MKAPSSSLSGLAALTALLAVGVCAETFAQSVTTVPVGAVTLTVAAAPNSSTPKYTYLNLPLLNSPLCRSRIDSVSASGLVISQAITEVFSASNPYFLKIESGPHSGSIFYVNSNTGSSVALNTQGVDLTTLSPAIATGSSGVMVSLIPADTLQSVFADLTQGASTANGADQIWLWQAATGQYAKYYYNTTNGRWQDATFGANSNNVVLKPDSGVVFLRRATNNLDIVLTGEVPSAGARPYVKSSGYTLVSGGFPMSSTLATLALNTNPSWVSAASAASADQVWVWQSGTGQFAKYYYNTTNSRWQDTVFNSNSNAVSVGAGVAFFIKKAAATGSDYSAQQISAPYTL